MVYAITMSDLKTQPTREDAEAFLESVADTQRREDSLKLLAFMNKVTGEEPVMWGTSIVGFGKYRYKYASGREGDWPKVAFAPRKQALTLYITDRMEENQDLLSKLGTFKTSVGCIYVKKLDDIDLNVLEELVKRGMAAPDVRVSGE